MTIAADSMTPARIAARASEIARVAARCGVPANRDQARSLRRIARHNEAMRRYIRAEKVDVVHSHFAIPEGTCGVLAADGKPVILSLRGVDILVDEEAGYGFLRNPLYRRNLRKALKRVAGVTVASQFTRSALDRFSRGAVRPILIPNGVDITRFSSATADDARRVRDKYGITNEPLVLAVGSLRTIKAMDLLVRAGARLRSSYPNLILLIVGDGPQREALRRLGDELGLNARLILPGRVGREELPAYYAACDVFAHPSRLEGFGNVVLEAMAGGRAVVATRTGAAADLVVDGANGLSVPPGDEAALASAIKTFLDNPSLRESCADAARNNVLQNYTLQQRAERFVSLYERALAEPRKTG